MFTCICEHFVFDNHLVGVQGFIKHLISCILIGQIKQHLKQKKIILYLKVNKIPYVLHIYMFNIIKSVSTTGYFRFPSFEIRSDRIYSKKPQTWSTGDSIFKIKVYIQLGSEVTYGVCEVKVDLVTHGLLLPLSDQNSFLPPCFLRFFKGLRIKNQLFRKSPNFCVHRFQIWYLVFIVAVTIRNQLIDSPDLA